MKRTRHRLDPAALFEEVVGTSDPWQRKALRSDSRRQLYLASRQSGKSSVAAIKALHTARFEERSLVLLVSPSLPQSQEIFRKCLTAYRGLGRPEGVASESALRLELGNGSRIISLPGSERTNVGYSADLLVVDEAARTPSELVEGMLPTVAVTGGSIIALTTPAGARGWFHSLWSSLDVEEVWERFEITADECPRITEEIIEEARMTRGERHVRQEYFCDFLTDAESFFNPEDLERSLTLTDPEEPLWFPERNAN
jgi:Terminase large subunit, T4likevirus-type, N-terminal